ncbi:hypothetical protein Pmar_PMAR028185 [Perkinsus marinus ATCC 50983]|uniref:RING-type domain-containing protein n=1 Tax=Perkinsus marinus (strain ATCC 50983 / TXsc) TaxID=423536 RepID=C5LB69_PERM5|nr:hypothetical protein Pmar_PMAR017299 [Perkinsus marinus ATCC 50983]XP_002774181.1 hypothetical protein Pmar_PMAR028185 [Perkinsus marinus ATCC 50983]EER03885.1 hypothetical protein Pmar_PMAR017299 [Perkinsus marinus ATCC 50983]EER05997.1 hypothetical protein Pmar_PMAR028185 [Perkinsus marinus ATCC 50983]|eukprot:XP_002772069.1 hypothetical protein Pmar_PMAR017299 [Perkinsus marinus ATCC 50983]
MASDESKKKLAEASAQQLKTDTVCKCCHKQEAEFGPSTCGHIFACKRCAMKIATGGKCKVCGELFADIVRA